MLARVHVGDEVDDTCHYVGHWSESPKRCVLRPKISMTDNLPSFHFSVL